ncbi:unnamed protein product [Rotaria socialis]|nr:unnamed protein product [Rotaria socialis]
MLVDKQHERPTHSSLQQSAPVSQLPTTRVITQPKVSSRTSSLLSRIQSNKTIIPLTDVETSKAVTNETHLSKFSAESSISQASRSTSGISLLINSKRGNFHDLNDTETCKSRKYVRRLCGGWCPCCSFCCCIVSSVLLALLLAGLVTLIVLLNTSNKATSEQQLQQQHPPVLQLLPLQVLPPRSRRPLSVTITSNDCTSNWTGVSILYHCDNCANVIPYAQYTYTYVAIATATRISFAFREDIGLFLLDDVSVVNVNAPSVQLIVNGGFETGSLSSPWIYCNPYGASAAAFILSNSANLNWGGVTFLAHSGSYCYCDGAVTYADYLSQTFPTNVGDTYNISYWIYNCGSGSASSADVLLSI